MDLNGSCRETSAGLQIPSYRKSNSGAARHQRPSVPLIPTQHFPVLGPENMESKTSYEHKYDAEPPATTTSSSAPSSATTSTTTTSTTTTSSTTTTIPTTTTTAAVSADPVAQKIASGFRINYMTMSDASTGNEVWNSGTEWDEGLFENQLEAHVPATILNCPAVAREINFTSREELDNFRLEQRVYFQEMLMEEWFFDFGFVIPGSTNTWSSTIEAAGEGQMLPASLLNGKVKIVTSFYEGPLFVGSSSVRVFYDK